MCSILLLEEDQNLLMDIHNHIYVDMEYITEKVYPNHKKKSVYYRLNRLVKEKYLKNELLPLPVMRNRVRKSGRPQNVYTLATKGVEMVRGLRGSVHWKGSWSRRSASFVYHSLMLAKVECAMTLTSNQEERLELKEWINEPRATFQYATGRDRIVRPDGIAVIGLKKELDKNIGVFMEMERSYGSKEVLKKKIIRYNDFMAQERAKKEYRVHTGMAYDIPIWRLVFVAGNESREKELIRYLKGVSSPEIPVYITLFQDILQDPFGRIYRNIWNSDEKVRF